MGKAFNTFLAISTAGLSIPVTKALDDSKNKRESAAAAIDAPQPMPEAPKPEDSASKAADMVKKRRINQSQTIYTSPLGLSGEANIARAGLKQKLGQ